VFTADGVNTDEVFNQPDILIDPSAQSHDFWKGLGIVIISGNRITANGANLSIDRSSGDIHKSGIGYDTVKASPNILTLALDTIVTHQRATQTTITSGTFTVLDPGNYDASGTVTPIPGSANRATNVRVYLFHTGSVSVQYGQQWYASISDAQTGIVSETFVVEPNNLANAILIAVISLRSGATDLTLPADALIYNASKFGEISIGAAGAQTTDLQHAYDNSTQPQITVTSALGGVQIIDAATPTAANLFEVQTNAPANVFAVDVSGVILDTAVGSAVGGAVSLFDTTTTGQITLGAALTTGDITLGNASSTNTVNINNSISLADDVKINLGTGDDAYIQYFNNATLEIINTLGNISIKNNQSTKSIYITLGANTSSETVKIRNGSDADKFTFGADGHFIVETGHIDVDTLVGPAVVTQVLLMQ
jgi:hypothetical protein